MKKNKTKYQKPKIKTKKIKVDFFLHQERYFDSFAGSNIGGTLLAQSCLDCDCAFSTGCTSNCS